MTATDEADLLSDKYADEVHPIVFDESMKFSFSKEEGGTGVG